MAKTLEQGLSSEQREITLELPGRHTLAAKIAARELGLNALEGELLIAYGAAERHLAWHHIHDGHPPAANGQLPAAPTETVQTAE